MRNHVRISAPGISSGNPNLVKYDKFVAVDENGNEAEFSQAVRRWELISDFGSVRVLRIELLAFVIDDEDTHLQATEGKGS